MNNGCILQVADYSAAFFSNFLSSLLRLQRSVRDELDLESVFVFPESARSRPWLRAVAEAGVRVEFCDRDASHRERIRRLRDIGREHNACLYHSHFGTFDADVAYVAARAGAPVVWHMHSPYPEEGGLRQRVGERLKFTLLPRWFVDRVVAVSPSVAESATRHGAPASRFVTILSGIDTDRAHPLRAEERSIRRRARGLEEQQVVFVLLGWAPQRKGVDLFANAIRLVERRMAQRIRAIVVHGEGNADQIRSLVGGAPGMQVIPPISDVADLYGLADCFVSASRVEGLPYAIGEAMSAELPVVSSDLPQVVAAYRSAGPGFVAFRSGDEADLARALSEVARMSPEARLQLGTANRDFVRATYSLDRWTGEIVALYRSLLGQPP